ncbi:hypothetical protein [Frateuria sp. Soil773]|uniref:hypothetical protein n=1 Tax=Frateuria sp. Soil773 TaxID=1736407 RepID=UPI0012FA3EC6|nr:hypothetical protein [Frateuria sp. Soil773]
MMKKYKQQAPTTYTTDATGQRLAHVALTGTCQRATLYADDLERLLEAGWSPHWSWCKTNPRFSYVLVGARTMKGVQRSLTVARLIADAGKGQCVVYNDGDRTNLRRDNLRLVRGSGRVQTPAAAVLPKLGECVAEDAQDASIGPQRATQGVGNTIPTDQAENAPPRHTSPVTQQALSEPRRLFTPRVVNRAALSAKVKVMHARSSEGAP